MDSARRKAAKSCNLNALQTRTVIVAALALLSLVLPGAAYEPEPPVVVFPDTCPAGSAGDECRRGLGTESGVTDVAGSVSGAPPSNLEYDWKAVEGCAIPAGQDIGEPQLLTVEEARRKCGSLEQCQGFTFEGNDVDGPLSGNAIWVHLKERFDCVDAEWVAYRKLARHGSRNATPAPPPPPPPEMEVALTTEDGEGLALCLTGQVRMLQTTNAAMMQNLIAVLRPDVFMYGPQDPARPDGPELYDLAKHVVASRWENENIRTQLYAETRSASRVIELEYLEVQGNWFGNQCLNPPLKDSRPGSAICFYYNQNKCISLIQEHETERGLPYEWVVISRTDFRWLAPHPPLELLSGKDAVWIPSGSDWEGGINDRHAVMRRKHADMYLSAWKLITRGQAKEVMLDTLGSMKVMGYPGPNTECFLRARLAHYGIQVERFPNVAFLTCTQRDKSRWTQCSGTMSNDAPGWLYKEEMEHATRVAKCIRSSWNSRKMSDCHDDISHLYRGFR